MKFKKVSIAEHALNMHNRSHDSRGITLVPEWLYNQLLDVKKEIKTEVKKIRKK